MIVSNVRFFKPEEQSEACFSYALVMKSMIKSPPLHRAAVGLN